MKLPQKQWTLLTTFQKNNKGVKSEYFKFYYQ